jgi:hypothetical protein
MAKLHELLAVEGQLKGQAEASRKDLRNTFEKKRHLFEEKRATFFPSAEGAKEKVEAQSDIQTTVREELGWMAGIWGKALDVSHQVAEANTSARADVKLDSGTVLLTNVPATALLELEKRMGELQELVAAIPTLDPAKGFKPDSERGRGIYAAREVHKTRTAKVLKALVKYPATAEHPAQTETYTADEAVGTLHEQEWSALLTPAEKGELLERTEELRRAIKQARQRANDVELATAPNGIATALFGYVLGTRK